METEGLNAEAEAFLGYLKRPTRRRLAKVVRLYQAHVWNAALRVTGNREDAEDICQDLFLALLLKPPAPDGVRSPKGYLAFRVLTLAERLSRAVRRRHEREVKAARQLLERNDASDQDLEAVRDAIRSLPDRPRACLELRYLGGLSVAEVARCLELSERTVAADLSEGKEIVRRRLTGAGLGAVLVLEALERAGAEVPPPRVQEELLRIASWGQALSQGAAAGVLGGMIFMKKTIAAITLLLALSVLLLWRPWRPGDPAGRAPGAAWRDVSPPTASRMEVAPEGTPADSKAAPREAPPRPSVLVSGFVVDRECAPVPDALVQASFGDTPASQTRTGMDGGFSLSWPRPEEFHPWRVLLAARKAGFALGWAQPERGVGPAAGDLAFPGIVIVLSPGAAGITGRVLSETGERVAGASVRAIPITGGFQFPLFIPEAASFPAAAGSSSGEDGLFEIRDLSPFGAFDLEILHPDHLRGRFRHVVPGGSPLEYVLARGVCLEGRVVDPEAKGVPGALVKVAQVLEDRFPTGSPHLAEVRTGTGGAFRFRIPPSTYRVSVEPPPGGFQKPLAELIEVTEDVGGYEVALLRASIQEAPLKASPPPSPSDQTAALASKFARIHGTLTDLEGAPVPGVVALSVTVELKGFVDTRRETETGLDGAFELEWPADGFPARLVAASPWLGLHGERVISGREEGEAIQLKLELCPEARVKGRVEDSQGRPIGDAGIVVSRSYEGGQRAAGAAQAGADGSFVLGDLLPWTGYWITPVIAGRHGPSVIIRILPGENEVTVPVPDPVALQGTVRDREGRPLGGLEVTYEYSNDDTVRFQYCATDAEGRFSVPKVFPGTYQVIIDNRGYSFWAKEVTTSDPPVEAVLHPSRRVRFELVTPDGEPVTAVRVSGEAREPQTQPVVMWSEEGTYSVEAQENETRLTIEAWWQDHPTVERALRWPASGDLDLGRIVARRE